VGVCDAAVIELDRCGANTRDTAFTPLLRRWQTSNTVDDDETVEVLRKWRDVGRAHVTPAGHPRPAMHDLFHWRGHAWLRWALGLPEKPARGKPAPRASAPDSSSYDWDADSLLDDPPARSA
jgi:hypothetical protein